MKLLARLAFTSVALSPLLMSAEMMESLKTREGREYFKVEILSNDDVGIRIRHDAGMARIGFQNLPADLQAKYHYDPSKAAAQKAEESRAQLEHETGVPAVQDKPKNKPPVSKLMDGNPPVAVDETNPPVDDSELLKLEAYLVKMKLNVETGEKEAKKLRSQAEAERFRKRSTVKGYNYKGNATSEMVDDKSGHVKADKLVAQAEVIERQLLQARALIGTAEAKYNRLIGNPQSPEPGKKSPATFR